MTYHFSNTTKNVCNTNSSFVKMPPFFEDSVEVLSGGEGVPDRPFCAALESIQLQLEVSIADTIYMAVFS